jgi:3-oxoacyl-[acyl-carrier-protein] synthase-3
VTLELDYVSCGSPVALRVARALVSVEQRLQRVLIVAGSCESRLLDYSNARSRFMFNFGDGAVAALLVRDHHSNLVLETAMLTDGSLSQHVKVPAGGSVSPASHETVELRQHFLDVEDLSAMRARLDEVSVENFVAVSEEAASRSGVSLADVAFVCPIHMKRSMHDTILDRLGCRMAEDVYLDDTGHMSGVDPLLSLDRLWRAGRLGEGDLVLLLAAGTGYTWAATVVRWGPGAG